MVAKHLTLEQQVEYVLGLACFAAWRALQLTAHRRQGSEINLVRADLHTLILAFKVYTE